MSKIQRIYTKNAAYQKFLVLLSNRVKRHKYNEFIVEGVRNINEAVKNGWQINSFIYPHKKKLSGWAASLLENIKTNLNYELDDVLMNELSGKQDVSELIAVANMKNDENIFIIPETLRSDPVFVLFDRPSNKGNLGTTLRSCDAFGAELLIITGHGVDIYDPEVIAASAGSFFKVPFVRLSDNSEINRYINELKSKFPRLKIIGTTAHDKTVIYDIDLNSSVLLLIGNETDGLSRFYYDLCDVTATIPMDENSSASSLNVSCAAAIMLYEAARQRRTLNDCPVSG